MGPPRVGGKPRRRPAGRYARPAEWVKLGIDSGRRRMSRVTPATTLVFVLPLLLAGSARPQQQATEKEPTLTFPTGVEQVTVDVVVIDKKGQPVTDLTRKDVEVYEDGVRQEIASFDPALSIARCTWSRGTRDACRTRWTPQRNVAINRPNSASVAASHP